LYIFLNDRAKHLMDFIRLKAATLKWSEMKQAILNVCERRGVYAQRC